MVRTALVALFLLAQLTAPGGGLPQILQTDFKPVAPIKAGVRGEVAATFIALPGYAVDRTLPFILNLTPPAGIKLAQNELKASGNDPKAKDQYFVDLPVIKVAVTAAKPGKYEIPGKLSYFFCSKKDGFCSTQKLDVKMPVVVQ
jgi:hypothetical protein